MKRFILGLTVVLTLISAVATANPITVDEKIQQAFSKEFSGAQYVRWDKMKESFRATFNYEGHRISAYFSSDGELLSTTRYIRLSQAPLRVLTGVKNRFPDSNIQEAVLEVVNEGETTYYITVEKDEKSVVVKSSAYGEVTVIKKTKSPQEVAAR